ncbi:uncharacterized [Tachysurus ichikawai]
MGRKNPCFLQKDREKSAERRNARPPNSAVLHQAQEGEEMKARGCQTVCGSQPRVCGADRSPNSGTQAE